MFRPTPTWRPAWRALLAAAVFTASADAATRHDYRVEVDAALTTLSVTARLAGDVRRLRARDDGAAEFLHDPRHCVDEAPLPVRQGAIRLHGAAPACVRYDYRLEALSSRGFGRRDRTKLIDRLASPSAWLWLPRIDAQTEIQVSFALPEGIKVSVPWEPLDAKVQNAYRFGASPNSSDALAVFGAFEYRELAIPGATLRVSLLRSDAPMDNEKILRWLRASATDVALAYGRFPNPEPQIIVVPVGARGRSPVPFGRVIRDGGEAVQFFVDQTKPLDAFLGDWTATHEFSHLLLPYVDRKWVSEGFASYYQNVLLARAGVYSERRAWQKLHDGFERGRKSAPARSPNAATMRDGLMKIYWSGAAVALLADAELRARSGGHESLDTVLGRLQTCCLPSQRTWGGREFFVKLDTLTEWPVFGALYDEFAAQPGFPDLRNLYARLGLRVTGDRLRLIDDAQGSSLRRAIMARNAAAAAARAGR